MRKLNLSHSQQGAVMAEFIVISAMVLLPLFMGLIFIGKYTENKQKVEIASRYSGWERTVWYEKIPKSLRQANPAINTVKDNAQIGYEIENRIFANKNAGIYQKQGENKTHETMDSMTESFWVDNKAGRPSIYAEDKKNKKSFINASLSQAAKGYGFSADGLKNFFSLMSKLGNFDLNLRGAFTSTVNLKLKKPKFLDKVWDKEMDVTRTYTILADGWNAAGPDHAKTMVQSTVLMEAMDFNVMNKIRKAISYLPMGKELGPDSLMFGHVEPEAVPNSRLSPYTGK